MPRDKLLGASEQDLIAALVEEFQLKDASRLFSSISFRQAQVVVGLCSRSTTG